LDLFLDYLKKIDGTKYLLPSDELRGTWTKFDYHNLSKMKRVEAVDQVTHGMEDVQRILQEAFKKSAVPDMFRSMHWPLVKSVYKINDGTVVIPPGALVEDIRGSCNFVTWMSTLFRGMFDEDLRSLEDVGTNFDKAHKQLHRFAALLFNLETGALNLWDDYFSKSVTVPYDTFAMGLANIGVSSSVINAVFVLLNSSNTGTHKLDYITLEMFAKAYNIFGKWWEGRMLHALQEKIISDAYAKGHFFIHTTSEASNYLLKMKEEAEAKKKEEAEAKKKEENAMVDEEEKVKEKEESAMVDGEETNPIVLEYLEYIIRPRNKVDSVSYPRILHPFAITYIKPDGTVLNRVICFDGRHFFIPYDNIGTPEEIVVEGEGIDILGLCEKFMDTFVRRRS